MPRFTQSVRLFLFCLMGFVVAACAASPAVPVAGPLPAWNDGPARQAIVEFVTDVTTPGSEHYVPPAERIAVFDNDGTLWAEKPTYFQLLFIVDRVRALAPQHPEWADEQPFKALLEGDMATVAAGGEHALMELAMATHAGMDSEEFAAAVAAWIDTARHPVSGRRYTEMVYQPMLELLDYLRDNGFKTFIVSGGGIAFMRPWTEAVYGIPPDQVVGSSVELRFVTKGDDVAIERLPELHFIDDKAGKPVGIQRYIGRRPILAAGNSDGDYEMLRWTTAGDGRRLGLIVHHTDAEREWAYDRDSHEGRLDRALDEAGERGWTVIDMANDWSRIWP